MRASAPRRRGRETRASQVLGGHGRANASGLGVVARLAIGRPPTGCGWPISRYSRPPPPGGIRLWPPTAPLRPGAAPRRPRPRSSARRSSPTSSPTITERRRLDRAPRRLGPAPARLPDRPSARRRVSPAPVQGAADAARVAVAQPADRRRRRCASGSSRTFRARRRRPDSPPPVAGDRQLRPPVGRRVGDRGLEPPAAARAASRRPWPRAAARRTPARSPQSADSAEPAQMRRVCDGAPDRTALQRCPSIFRGQRDVAVWPAPRLGHGFQTALERSLETGQHQPSRHHREPDQGSRDAFDAGAAPSICKLRHRGQQHAARTTPPGTGRTSPTTSTSRVWGRQGENCGQVPQQGPPGGDRRPPALARMDDAGGTEAPSRRYHR